MELQTISQVSKELSVSTRTLRYYEQIGLIQAVKKEDFAYRSYEEDTISRLRHILLLRKLRIPLKQIADILDSEETATAIRVFTQNLGEIEDEITALSSIKRIIESLLDRLHLQRDGLGLLDDESLLDIADSLTVSRIHLKEDKTMDELNKANEKLDKLTDREVRILYVPPMTVAAAHYIGDGPEGPAGDMLRDFIQNTDLLRIHPGARCFGFNHPNPGIRADGIYGYEFQVTIPEDMEVPAPLVKKRTEGGLYAAYMILMDEIAGIGWNRLFNGWLKGHEIWEGNMSSTGENMFGLLEEHLNLHQWQAKGHFQQVDLLMPVREKQQP